MSSYPKEDKNETTRSASLHKRKFYGNQHSKNEAGQPSTNARKLSSDTSEDIYYNPMHFYRIIEFSTVFTVLSELVI